MNGGNGGVANGCNNNGARGAAGGAAYITINSTEDLQIDSLTITSNPGDGSAGDASAPASCGCSDEPGGDGGLAYNYIYTNISNITDLNVVIPNSNGGAAQATYQTGDDCDTDCADPGGKAGGATVTFENAYNGTDTINNLDIDINRGTPGASDSTAEASCDDPCSAHDGTSGPITTHNYLTLEFYNVTWDTGTIDIQGDNAGNADVAVACDGDDTYDTESGRAGGNIYYYYYDDFADINNVDMTFVAGQGGDADAKECGGYGSNREADGGTGGTVYVYNYGYSSVYSDEIVNISYNVDGGTGGKGASVNNGDADSTGGSVNVYLYDTLNFGYGTWDINAGDSGDSTDNGDCYGGSATLYNHGSVTFNNTNFNLAAGDPYSGCDANDRHGVNSNLYNYNIMNIYGSDFDLVSSVAAVGSAYQGDVVVNSNGTFRLEDYSEFDCTAATLTGADANLDFNTTLFKIRFSNLTTTAFTTSVDMNTIDEVQFKNSTISLDGDSSPDFNIYTSNVWLHGLTMVTTDTPDTDVYLIYPFEVANDSQGTALGNWVFNETVASITDDDYHSYFTNVNFTKTDGSASPKLYDDTNATCNYEAYIDSEGIGPYKVNITFFNGTNTFAEENETSITSATPANSTILLEGNATVGEIWNCSVALYSDFTTTEVDSETVSHKYPYNLKVYTGNYSDVYTEYSGELTADWNVTLDKGSMNKYIQDSCTSSLCRMPIRFVSDEETQINVSSLSANYGVSSPSTADVTVPFNISTTHSGKINLTKIDFDYLNLTNQTIRVRGYYTIGGTDHYVDDLYLTVYYSNFSINILPTGINYWDIGPNIYTWVQNYIPPFGNDDGDGNPFWNITKESPATHDFDVHVKYNESVDSCATTWFQGENVSSGALHNLTLNTSQQILVYDLDTTGTDISTWTNISCAAQNSTLITPYFCFFSQCEGCVKTSDWDSNCDEIG